MFTQLLRRSCFLVVIIAGCIGIHGCKDSSNLSGEKTMADQDPMLEARTFYLDVVGGLNSDDYIHVDDFAELPGEVFFNSMKWTKLVFQEGMGPHSEQANARHAYHVARPAAPGRRDFDLIRHEYTAKVLGGEVGVRRSQRATNVMPVIVTECAVYIHILLPGVPASLGRAFSLAPVFFNIPEALEFRSIQGDPRYQAFSSHPDRTLTEMSVWNDRIDGAATQDGLVFMIYKRDMGFGMYVDPSRWFPDSFRNR